MNDAATDLTIVNLIYVVYLVMGVATIAVGWRGAAAWRGDPYAYRSYVLLAGLLWPLFALFVCTFIYSHRKR